MNQPSNKLIVIVPAHNEAASIVETIQGLRHALQSIKKYKIEPAIYVIDDGSTDATRRIAQEAGADRVLFHSVRQGLGAAVRTGLVAARQAGAGIVVKIDADLQHDPNDIEKLIQPILSDEADVVYGNRFQRISYRMPLIRKIGNHIFTALMRWLTRWQVRDSQPGIIAINHHYLERFRLFGDYNYTQQLLLDAYHKGMRFAHVPVSFRSRKSGKSFVTLKYPLAVSAQILMALVSLKPLRVFAPIGLLFIFIGSTILFSELWMWHNGQILKPVLHVNAVMGCFLFGLQTFFFGILAELIVKSSRQ